MMYVHVAIGNVCHDTIDSSLGVSSICTSHPPSLLPSTSLQEWQTKLKKYYAAGFQEKRISARLKAYA
jgi:hypothetical protein